MMELRSLRFAITLAEELHFGRAAQRHFLAAQPFGQQIQALERELGVKLFGRTTRRVWLTPEGTRFIARIRPLLTMLDKIAEESGRPARSDDDRLVLGVLGFGLGKIGDLAIGTLAERVPLVSVHFAELDMINQYEAVRRGDVDVAFVHCLRPVDGIELTPVTTVQRVTVVPADSPLADANWLTASDLEGYRWLKLRAPDGFADWAGCEVETRCMEGIGNPAMIPAAVAMTGAIAPHGLPAGQYFHHPRVRFVPTEGPEATVGLATRIGDRNPSVEALRRAVSAVASTIPAQH